jgi:3-hydroxyisobutyrate dehydrogenase-like beta-hydroxyacid dehydrogenase
VTTPGEGDGRSVGVIGLGNIGSGVCANLIADGHRVTAFDTDEAKLGTQVANGAAAANDAAGVAEACDITFLSLPDPAVMSVVSAHWVGGAGPGKVLVDLSTNSPETVRRVARDVEAAGARFVESPVTGGAIGSRNRQLFFIIGGDPADVAEVRPLLESLGRGLCHLGPIGCGNVGKLVNSLLAFSTQVTALEGLALAASNGIDLRTLVEMLRTTGGAHSYLQQRVEEIATRGRPAEFTMDLAAKDAGLMVELGRQSSVPVPIASAIHQMLVYAKAHDLGDHDISDMVEVMEQAAALQLELPPPPDEQPSE